MRFVRALLLTLVCAAGLNAHVGSPDVYLDGQAGPYKLFITIRPPSVIPGVAEIDVRSETPGVERISAVPLPMSGPGAKFAPVPDALKRTSSDAQFFSGALWLMAPGSWQVRLEATGSQGAGKLSVPIPAVALRTKTMDFGLGSILFVLMLVLAIGFVATVRAGAQEGDLSPAAAPDQAHRRKGWRAAVVSAVIITGTLGYGATWWNSQEQSYGRTVFRPLDMQPSVTNGALTLKLSDPGWIGSDQRLFAALPASRSVDDLALDHGHLMHLYMIRQPGLDVALHLHPEQIRPGEFRLNLPDMPAGRYKLYADIVHENGLPETPVAEVTVPQENTHPVLGDDAFAVAAPYTAVTLPATQFELPDHYRMEWLRDAGPLHARQPIAFRFRLVDEKGNAPSDMGLYLGMLGHAAFVKPDGSVFAHIHPAGSVSMAAFMQANSDMPMDQMGMNQTGTIPNEVTFPYGFPNSGRYRIFVQMKHGATVETGVFDTAVE